MVLSRALNSLHFSVPKSSDRDDYRSSYTFQERQDAVRELLKRKRPGSIPIVCEKLEDRMPSMPHPNFALPPYLRMAELLHMIRFRLKLSSSTEALFLFINGSLILTNAELGAVYAERKDDDGWLYVTYVSEDTFGGV